jgi:superfamily II DNA or RNA helicase
MPEPTINHNPGTFEFIEQTIRQSATGTEFGTDFEWLCRFFLLNAPQYKGVFKSVWLWKDWPDGWGADKGIDLVAETIDGQLWAIPAKAVHHERSIPKSELDSFLSESNRPQFDYRLIVATTDDIGRNAKETLAGQEKQVGLILRGELLTAEVNWPSRIGEKAAPLPRKKPRPHQAAAIKEVVRGFCQHERGQLIMACGTGKTLTALWIAQKLRSRRTLILVPSLSLISQTLIAWGANCARPFDYLVVCSDETVIQRGDDAAITSTNELGVPVTTDVGTIRRFLKRRHAKPAVVFATYQSSDRIAAAQKGSAPHFDLVLADEAHRCTGPADGLFTTVLDATKIKARRRLFMTATPRYFTGRVKKRAEELEYELASMDDESRSGPEFHRLPFNAAIRAELLTDYQVVVIGVTQAETRQWAEEGRLLRTKDGMVTDARTLASQIGLAKAMRQYDLRKTITFHSSVTKASRFTDAAQADSLGAIERMSPAAKPSGELWTGHISGQTPAGRRSTLLTVFGNLPQGSRGVLSNCACLGEGVDVPVLDGVGFIDPKRSMIDIIQAVGRVIRKADDKKIGTVVIPVFVDESEDADHALSNSAFEPVWQVLKALRAHDQELANELDELRLKLGERSPGRGKIRLPDKIKVDVPTLVLADFEQSFYVRTVEETTRKPALTEEMILGWADAHYEATGDWPTVRSGPVHDAPSETWSGINAALMLGLRGLAGGSSIANFLAHHRGRVNRKNQSLLNEGMILDWADAHNKQTGNWPLRNSGPVYQAPGEKWNALNSFLIQGGRGLSGGSSLAKLLAEHRNVRNKSNLACLEIQEILRWADGYYKRTGKWPTRNSGLIEEAPGDTWSAVNVALFNGNRGLPGNSSLPKILSEHRGVRNPQDLSPLTIDQVLAWADSCHQRTGEWPSALSGEINESPGEKWSAVDIALRQGARGFTRGSSLAKVLEKHRGRRNHMNLASLTEKEILDWADSFHQRTGEWPKVQSGPIQEAPGQTWVGIEAALQIGNRGLPGGSSVAKLLAKYRGVRNPADPPSLTIDQILSWADTHYQCTGKWPAVKAGPVYDAPGESWAAIDASLTNGRRGLPVGSSLARLLEEYRGIRNKNAPPSLMVDQILAWADEHHERAGHWPTKESGPLENAPGETWSSINCALNAGLRGLPGDSSLANLLAEHCGRRNCKDLPKLTIDAILAWIDAFYLRSSQWPTAKSGPIDDMPEENWRKVDNALRIGLRGLPAGSSLACLIKEHSLKPT